MVTLKKIKINNFLSHKETEISFKENQKLLISGDSGSGKSSIIEAIIWNLYGKARVENKNLIKRGTKFTTVILEIEDNGKFYRIERSVTSTGKHTLEISEKKTKIYVPMKHIGLRNAQEWLERELLHSSYTLFVNSVACPQDSVEGFVKQIASRRKELLLEIANTESFDDLYEKAKIKLSAIEYDLMNEGVLVQNIDLNIDNNKKILELIPKFLSELAKSKNIIEDLVKKIDEVKTTADYIQKLENQISNNNLQILSLKSRILSIKKVIEEKKNKIQELEKSDISDIGIIKDRLVVVNTLVDSKKETKKRDYEHSLRRQAIITGKRPIIDYSANLERLEGQLMDIMLSNNAFCQDLGRNCPKLENEIKNKSRFIEEQIKDLKERISLQEKENKEFKIALEAIPLPELTDLDLLELKKLEEEKIVLEEKVSKAMAIDEIKKQIVYIGQEMESLKIDEMMLTSEIKQLEEVNVQLSAERKDLFCENLAALDTRLNAEKDIKINLEYKINITKEAQEKIFSLEKQKQELILKNKKLYSDKESLELIKDAFGSKGIKTVIVDYLIPRLEYRINEILSKMSDFKIRLETQKEKADGEGNTEGLFINIYNSQNEIFSFENYSGGEKIKISISITEALAALQKCSFRIFDESFQALDEDSLESFNEVMHSLQDKFSQVLCISHLQTIKDSFEEKINIIKEGDTSKIL
jgi:DNA repair protein SbcC/Rad50